MIQQITDLFNSELDYLENKDNCIIIHLKNGQTIPLYNSPIEIETNIPCCNFCGEPALGNITLFNKNGYYICNNCASEAISAFVKNKVNINIKIEDEELKNSLNEMIDKMQNIKNNHQN